MYANIRSILSKIDLVKTIISENKPDIITFTETWTNDSTSGGFLQLDGYSLIKRKDRKDTTNGFGGGILTYAKSDLICHEMDLPLLDKFNQATGITVGDNHSNVNVVTIYRPHKLYNGDNLEENNERLIGILSNAPNPTIFVGDFNYPKINWENQTTNDRKSDNFLQAVQDNFLTQHVNFATHNSGNILDLVLTNKDELLHGVDDTGFIDSSDHTSIMVTAKISLPKKTKAKKWSWSRADVPKIKQELSQWDWASDMNGKGAEEATNQFIDKLTGVMNRHIPTYTPSTRERPPWMGVELQRMIRKKKRQWQAYKEHGTREKLEEHRALNNKCKKMIRKAKKRFEYSLTEANNINNNRFFNYIRSRTSNKANIGPLKDNNTIINEDKDMCNLLNKFFCSVFNTENGEAPEIEPFDTEQRIMPEGRVTIDKVKEKLKNLKKFGAPGPDGLFPSFLKEYWQYIAAPLTYICETSLNTGQIPDIWKTANVIPIFKKGSKFEPGNYRPISLTCVPGRVCESLIKDQIVEHLNKYDLICRSQFGFMKNKSCALNLLTYLETVTKEVDSGNPVDLVYLDYAKAFDKVPHRRLIKVLKAHGLNHKIINWIENWLKGRTQVVTINGERSETGKVTSGVPQGSILGPLLFIIYINTMDKKLTGLTPIISKFADDTKVGSTVKTTTEKENMTKAMVVLSEWANEWLMCFNESKCKVLHFGRRNEKIDYKLNGVSLDKSDSEKDIGVIVHTSLKPTDQCNRAAWTANTVLGQMTRAVQYRDIKTWTRLYTTYVRPYLEYSTTAWNPWNKKDIETLEKVQERALRQITSIGHLSYEEKLKHLGLTTLEERRHRADMIQVWKILHGHDDTNEEIWFNRYSNTNSRPTRNNSNILNLKEPAFNTEIRRNFFSIRVCKPWNNIPIEIREESKLANFRLKYDKWRNEQRVELAPI